MHRCSFEAEVLLPSRVSSHQPSRTPLHVARRLSALLLITAVLGACKSNSLEIESGGAWKGTYTEGDEPKVAIEGTGNLSIEMKSNNFCWSIQKQTEAGRLHVYARLHSFISTDTGGDRETFAPFGVVVGCSGNL